MESKLDAGSLAISPSCTLAAAAAVKETKEPADRLKRRTRKTMTIAELRDHVARLSPKAKISDSFERQRRRDSGSRKVWYHTQQEHLLGWLKGYDGPGFYGRRRWDRDARFVYNHFQCPQGLLWLAEAAGVAAAKITEANEAVLSAPPRLSSQVGALRRVIPWSLVEAELTRK